MQFRKLEQKVDDCKPDAFLILHAGLSGNAAEIASPLPQVSRSQRKACYFDDSTLRFRIRRMFLTIEPTDWQAARELGASLHGWIFRGQRDASWFLDTSLQRAGQQGQNFPLSKREKQVIEAFRRRAHHFLTDPPATEDEIEWMALIQHFGGPTRLLDFTSSFCRFFCP